MKVPFHLFIIFAPKKKDDSVGTFSLSARKRAREGVSVVGFFPLFKAGIRPPLLQLCEAPEGE